MARPQLEDGHTQIANELLEHLAMIHLSPNQWQVLLCIIRKTYGFHKKVDYIANFQIVRATGLNRHVVSRTLKGLRERNIINRNTKSIGIQKDWEQWQLPKLITLDTKLPEQATDNCYLNRQPVLPEQATVLPIHTTNVTSPRVTQKKKETIQKKLYKRYGEFKNVLLTDDEYEKLKARFNSRLPERIEVLSEGIASKGYKYKDHYATILSWARRDEQQGGKNGTYREDPFAAAKGLKPYTRPPVFRD